MAKKQSDPSGAPKKRGVGRRILLVIGTLFLICAVAFGIFCIYFLDNK